jgi:adenosylcobyric acid synthase
MLGKTVADPQGMEGEVGITAGFGLLDAQTTLLEEKRLTQVAGRCAFADAAVKGYEIHVGETQIAGGAAPAFIIDGKPEGMRSSDDAILGTYLHGVFDHPEACSALLRWAGLRDAKRFDVGQLREQSIDRIADASLPLYRALCKTGIQ